MDENPYRAPIEPLAVAPKSRRPAPSLLAKVSAAFFFSAAAAVGIAAAVTWYGIGDPVAANSDGIVVSQVVWGGAIGVWLLTLMGVGVLQTSRSRQD